MISQSDDTRSSRLESNVEANLKTVQNAIVLACQASERCVASVQLVAVSKIHDAERIRPALAAGHRVFGENRVQEAAAKWPALRREFPDVTLHLIGPLQTNKVRQAIETFDVIETLDREKLARALVRGFTQLGKSLPVFIQVNTGEEPQKAGVNPENVDDFVNLCRDTLGLDVQGLMCIPPVDEEPSLHFALLSKLAARNGLKGLSMGMSGDYETAIAFGATYVRVGSAIFGTRPNLGGNHQR